MEIKEPHVDQPSLPWLSITITVASVIAMIVLMMLQGPDSSVALRVAYCLMQTVVISIIIWQACDPFADAAQWIGVRFRLPGSVRGATLDAIASSLPELFTGIFFVIAAAFAVENLGAQEGFGASVATCAGSAVYNMMLIPAICAIVISISRKDRPTIDIDDKVISRDGLWFLGCELILIVCLFQQKLHWWMAFVLLAAYLAYVLLLIADARRFRKTMALLEEKKAEGLGVHAAIDAIRATGVRVSRDLADRVDDNDDDEDNEAGLLFGMFSIPLNMISCWTIIILTAIVAAAACYWLVEVIKDLRSTLDIPMFFVAVIVAAAASSVPDTFLSVGSAKRGDDDGAVSNAFGSNIFDITICLSIPLLLACYMNNWQPIELIDESGNTMPGLVGLRILLSTLTVITLLIMWHNRQLTRNKAFVLCGLYLIFVGYAVAGSLGFAF